MSELNGNKMAEDTVELDPLNLVSHELSCSCLSSSSQPELMMPPESLSSGAGQEITQGGKSLVSQVTLDENFLASLEVQPVLEPSMREVAKIQKEEEEKALIVKETTTGCPAVVAPRQSSRKPEMQTQQMLAEWRVLGSPAIRQQSWGDCHPHVLLLREALQSCAPDIAVLGPLQGCFSFYMTHFHNEVLSSTYARTSIFGANVPFLESAFMWFGGWRPTSALVLVYSLMGIEIENALEAARLGQEIVTSANSSLLSARQLAVMHTLQRHTQQAEMKLSKKLDVLQMLTSDQDMLEAVLLDAASNVPNDSSRFKRAVGKRMTRFRRLLVQAEELRLGTLKDLLSLLTPIQSARCGIAIFEFYSSLRAMGHDGPPLPLPLPLTLPAARLPIALPTIAMLPSVALPDRAEVVAHPLLVTGYANSTPPDSATSSVSAEMPGNDDVDTHGHAESSPLLDPSCSDRVFSSTNVVPQLALSLPDIADNEQASSSSDASTSPYVSSSEVRLEAPDPAICSGEGVDSSNHHDRSTGQIVSNRLQMLSQSTANDIIRSCRLDDQLLSVTSPGLEASRLEPPVNNGNDVDDTQPTGGKNRLALPGSFYSAYGKSRIEAGRRPEDG